MITPKTCFHCLTFSFFGVVKNQVERPPILLCRQLESVGYTNLAFLGAFGESVWVPRLVNDTATEVTAHYEAVLRRFVDAVSSKATHPSSARRCIARYRREGKELTKKPQVMCVFVSCFHINDRWC